MTTINSIEDLIRILDDNPEWLEALRSRLMTREVLELPRILSDFIENANRRFDALEVRMDRVESGVEETKSEIQGIRNDMGFLKAGHARNIVVEEAYIIAEEMGLQHLENLNREQLSRLVRENDTSDLSTGALRSFRRADLVIRALDGNEQPCYVAMEISFTVDDRDTRRAIRNAQLLTRFTGIAAIPAVSGVYLDDRAKPYVESGEISYYELEAYRMEVE